MYPNLPNPPRRDSPRKYGNFDSPQQVYDKDRGGCLSLWLIGSTLFSLYGLFVLCQAVSIVSDRSSFYSNRSGLMCAFVLLGAIVIGSLVSLFGIWNWKKWGVYGIATMSIASPIIEGLVGAPDASDLVAAVVQLTILYFLVKDKWDYFE